jgi:Spy/CpxP family protein refolding chaperone
VALLAPLPAVSQSQPEPSADRQTFREERIEDWKARLQLTDEQVAQLRPILEEQAVKLREIRVKYEGKESRRDRRRMLRELRSLQESTQKKIEPILTKPQREEWKKMRQERRDELRDRK